MLTLRNFEQQISKTILDRGRDYYESGAVINLEETEKDCWQAEVEGTDIYETEVRLKNNEITDYFCNCPYEGDLCKHVVAVLFAIREEMSQQKQTGTSKKEVFENLLQKITLQEYQDFIRQ